MPHVHHDAFSGLVVFSGAYNGAKESLQWTLFESCMFSHKTSGYGDVAAIHARQFTPIQIA